MTNSKASLAMDIILWENWKYGAFNQYIKTMNGGNFVMKTKTNLYFSNTESY